MTAKTLRVNPSRSTAFTSLVVGIFLNHSLVNPEIFPTITEDTFYERYGESFEEALAAFDRLSSSQQLFLLYQVQR